MSDETPKIEKVDPFPQFIKLHPDSKVLQAAGAPVGTIELGGRKLKVRCATMLDFAWFEQKTQKNPLKGEVDWRDQGFGFAAELAARALLDENNKPVEKAFIEGLGASLLPELMELTRAFLSVAPL